MKWRSVAVVAVTSLVMFVIVSCARTPIEEIARNSIREKAENALAIYIRVSKDTESSPPELVRQKMEEAMPGVYSVILAPGDPPMVDIYLRDHITTSGGFWGEQRTVSSCVRYSYDDQTADMKSIECPSTGPSAEYFDERVEIP